MSSTPITTTVDVKIIEARAPKLKKEVIVKIVVGQKAEKEVCHTRPVPARPVLGAAPADAPKGSAIVGAVDWIGDPSFRVSDYSRQRDGPMKLVLVHDGDVVGSCALEVTASSAGGQLLALQPVGELYVEATAFPCSLTKLSRLKIKGYKTCPCACDGPHVLFFKEKRLPPAECPVLSIMLKGSKVTIAAGDSGTSSKKPPMITIELDGASSTEVTKYEVRAENAAEHQVWADRLRKYAASFAVKAVEPKKKPPPHVAAPKPHGKHGGTAGTARCKLFGQTLAAMVTASTAPAKGKPHSPAPPLPPPSIPAFIEALFVHIEAHLDEGVYRLGSSPSEVQALLTTIEKAPWAPLVLNGVNVHTAAGVLKLFLKNLGAPIISPDLLKPILSRAPTQSFDPSAWVTEVRALVAALPKDSRALLDRIIRHLRLISSAEVTKMKDVALSIVFGPILVRTADGDLSIEGNGFVCHLMRYSEHVFSETPPTTWSPAHLISQSQPRMMAISPALPTHGMPSVTAAAAAAALTPDTPSRRERSHSHGRSHRPRGDKRSHRKAITKSLSVRATSAAELKTQAKRLFHHYDTLHSGKIGAETMMALLNDVAHYAPNQLAPFSADFISELVLSLSDADGQITYSQFKTWWVEANQPRSRAPQPTSTPPPGAASPSSSFGVPPPPTDEFVPPPPIEEGEYQQQPPSPPAEIDLQLTVTEEPVVVDGEPTVFATEATTTGETEEVPSTAEEGIPPPPPPPEDDP